MKTAITPAIRLKPQIISLFFSFKFSCLSLICTQPLDTAEILHFGFLFYFCLFFPKVNISITCFDNCSFSYLVTADQAPVKPVTNPQLFLSLQPHSHTCAKVILQQRLYMEFKMWPLLHIVEWLVCCLRCHSPKDSLIITLLHAMKFNYFIANQFQKCLGYSEAETVLG